ncbi:hypothetical protein GGF46_001820 [Coemansia sp. RSA 552]|nr:hypothetical protein GGF46_001820 [Coemansia sp. RSA 552]
MSVVFEGSNDPEVLRLQLRETTSQLQAAAHMGLELVERNQEMARRLDSMEEEHEDLRQRLGLVERDRRWMQEQSLRVDQVKASVNELLVEMDGGRSRRLSSDQLLHRLDYAVDRLREDLDTVVQATEQSVSPRKWAAEVLAVQRTLGQTEENVAALGSRLNGLEAKVTSSESRQRTYQADSTRRIADLDRRVAEGETLGEEAQMQAQWLAVQLHNLDGSLKTAVVEYNAMLDDHEQSIRGLKESQAAAQSGFAPPYSLNMPYMTLQTPETRHGRGSAPLLDQTPGCRPAQKRKDQAGKRDSGVAAREVVGERLDDIFALDSGTDSSGPTAFPSPPISMASSVPEHGPLFSPSGCSRKAVSVVGTPCGRVPSRPRVRQRVNSFSQLDANLVSSAKTPPAFSGIIYPSTHVGLGWGNYWEARRRNQPLQFDLQTRLGLSAPPSSAPANPAGSKDHGSDLSAAD